jgi:hypothetical protein
MMFRSDLVEGQASCSNERYMYQLIEDHVLIHTIQKLISYEETILLISNQCEYNRYRKGTIFGAHFQ